MYAIILQGGKQYRIAAGDEIVCDKVKGEPGDAVRFDKVLLVSDGDKTLVQPDDLAKYDVTGEIVGHFADDKVLVFKYKAKKGYRQKNGHRQQKSHIKITAIGSSKAPAKKAEAVKESPKAATKEKAKTAKAKAPAKPAAKAAKEAPKKTAAPKKEARPKAAKAKAKKTEATG